MQNITLYYLKNCPYCIAAMGYMDELRKYYPKYAVLEITLVEEEKEAEIAWQKDYFYVPCFYVGGKKVAEGSIDKSGVKKVFDMALEE